ncbi:UbiA family prenyltransferase [bacterium]|nr:UbiA family prenyltransferase [bacterium]
MRFFNLLDYFFVLRPILFFPGWTTTLAGFLAARNTQGHLGFFEANPSLILVCISSAMVMGAGFIVNQIKDKETDRVNQKLFFLSEGVTHQKTMIIETWILIVLSLAIAAFISWPMLFIHILALFLITVAYNLKPFSLKDRTFGSFIANSLMGIFAFAFGWFALDSSFLLFIERSLPYLFFNTALYFLTTIPDAEGDKLTQKKTICVVYGIHTTIYWALGFELISITLAGIAMDWLILIPSLMTLPFYVRLIVLKNVSASILTIKFGLLFFSLMVGIFFPWYIVLIILFFILTRFYYRRRFNIIYPNFRGE